MILDDVENFGYNMELYYSKGISEFQFEDSFIRIVRAQRSDRLPPFRMEYRFRDSNDSGSIVDNILVMYQGKVENLTYSRRIHLTDDIELKLNYRYPCNMRFCLSGRTYRILYVNPGLEDLKIFKNTCIINPRVMILLLTEIGNEV